MAGHPRRGLQGQVRSSPCGGGCLAPCMARAVACGSCCLPGFLALQYEKTRSRALERHSMRGHATV